MIIRQGDITLVRVADRHITTAPRPTILARGEESGHWHAADVVDIREGARRFVVVVAPTVLRVEPASHAGRHAPIDLAPGTYEVLGMPDEESVWLGQREYTPEAVRGVGD